MANKYNYYAVREGRRPGIYNNWQDCYDQVYRYSGAQYKGFYSLDSAIEYLDDEIFEFDYKAGKYKRIMQETVTSTSKDEHIKFVQPTYFLNLNE